jgi:ABC-type sugar transport system ATPase subunit
VSTEQLIRAMVGREITNIFERDRAGTSIGDVVLEVRGLRRAGAFRDISFAVRRGEVLGLSGLMGSQRSEIMRAILGIERLDGGEVLFEGRPVRFREASEAISAGIGFVPEDRKREGIIQTMSVKQNLTIASLPLVSRYSLIRADRERALTDEQVRSLDIKLASPDQPVTKLSGGNQQKVILGRFLALKPRLLVLDEPTRGIDVGAKAEVHRIISRIAREGVAVVMISSEMPEILGACDRILVLHEGRITGEYDHREVTAEKIMQSALR